MTIITIRPAFMATPSCACWCLVLPRAACLVPTRWRDPRPRHVPWSTAWRTPARAAKDDARLDGPPGVRSAVEGPMVAPSARARRGAAQPFECGASFAGR